MPVLSCSRPFPFHYFLIILSLVHFSSFFYSISLSLSLSTLQSFYVVSLASNYFLALSIPLFLYSCSNLPFQLVWVLSHSGILLYMKMYSLTRQAVTFVLPLKTLSLTEIIHVVHKSSFEDCVLSITHRPFLLHALGIYQYSSVYFLSPDTIVLATSSIHNN